jgi:excisionase family DNA binding protein
MSDLNLPKLLTPTETAKLLRVSHGTLAQWRHHKRYPLPFIKIGRAVRYLESEVKVFMTKGAA